MSAASSPGSAHDPEVELSPRRSSAEEDHGHAETAGPQEIRASEERKSRKDEVLDKLDDLLSGPRAARIVSGGLIVIAAIFICVGQISDFIERRNTSRQLSQHQNAEYRGGEIGTHDSSKDDAQGAAKAAKQTPQEIHLNHHIRILDGKPILVPQDVLASLGNGVDALSIQYFTSDGCIFVHRHRGNTETDDWLPDATKGVQKSQVPASGSEVLQSSGVPDLTRLLAADEYLGREPYRQPRLLRIQGGRCVSPHPGAFSWWWGPPKGCWVPMMRQFQDGCLHHQMFNACGNYWDASIFWDRCVH